MPSSPCAVPTFVYIAGSTAISLFATRFHCCALLCSFFSSTSRRRICDGWMDGRNAWMERVDMTPFLTLLSCVLYVPGLAIGAVRVNVFRSLVSSSRV